jgi:hypothetical protein
MFRQQVVILRGFITKEYKNMTTIYTDYHSPTNAQREFSLITLLKDFPYTYFGNLYCHLQGVILVCT